jgi:hypothetical protein
MDILRIYWDDSRCTGRHPDLRHTRQETTEEHRRE